jgi:hypothetical protein
MFSLIRVGGNRDLDRKEGNVQEARVALYQGMEDEEDASYGRRAGRATIDS